MGSSSPREVSTTQELSCIYLSIYLRFLQEGFASYGVIYVVQYFYMSIFGGF